VARAGERRRDADAAPKKPSTCRFRGLKTACATRFRAFPLAHRLLH
jgi:hypothetical protein